MARSIKTHLFQSAWGRAETLVAAELRPEQPSRRRFIGRAGTACGGLLLTAALPPIARGPLRAAAAASSGSLRTDAEVAVVGAGLAGLTAAYRLREAGIQARVYEADTRIGGRCWTIRGFFDQGQIGEAHAEFIDDYHHTVLRLIDELGLEAENLYANTPPDARSMFEIDGRPYPFWRIVQDLMPVVREAARDRWRAGSDTTYYQSTPYGRTLDHMSGTEWIESRVAGGMSSRIGQLLDVHIRNEWGMEPDRLSSLNIVYGLAGGGEEQARGGTGPRGAAVGRRRRAAGALAGGDEGPLTLWHVKGGTDLLTARLAGGIPGQIERGHRLVSAATEGGRVRLSFDTIGGSVETRVDRLVLALPFHILREVDLSALDLREVKRNAIQNLGIATNSKLIMQFSDRHWWSLGSSGDIWSDRDFQATWGASGAQEGDAGLLVDYVGGDYGAEFHLGTPESRAAAFLGDVEPLLPGLSDKWTGRVFRACPHTSPILRGSYPAYALGQFSTIRGLEGEVEGGKVHFAGDHTAPIYQGFLEGAAESGERAAAEVIDALSARRRRR